MVGPSEKADPSTGSGNAVPGAVKLAPPTPLVSIGMPLRNEGKFLREALEALLAQDYPNLELILSDNASTDATADICKEFAAKDPRVRYLRSESTLASYENFNRVFRGIHR